MMKEQKGKGREQLDGSWTTEAQIVAADGVGLTMV